MKWNFDFYVSQIFLKRQVRFLKKNINSVKNQRQSVDPIVDPLYQKLSTYVAHFMFDWAEIRRSGGRLRGPLNG